jgi:hypothetical protein
MARSRLVVAGSSRVSSFKNPLGLIVGVLLVAIVFASTAQAAGPVVRVEEDWTLVLNEPDDNVDSPQFHTVMSPFTHLDSYYAQVVWNYREIPDFVAGGLQLQSWNGETQIRTRSVGDSQLSTSAETITWTQSLETNGIVLLFQILNGESATWGVFGKDMNIDAEAYLPDLENYSPKVSVANSCITYGSNRVNVLMITEIRRYSADGELVSVDTAPRYVYQASE